MPSIDETESQLKALARIEKSKSRVQSHQIVLNSRRIAQRQQAGKDVLGIFVASLWTLFMGIGLTSFNALKSRQAPLKAKKKLK